MHGLRSTTECNDDYSNLNHLSIPSNTATTSIGNVNALSTKLSHVKMLYPMAVYGTPGVSLEQQPEKFKLAMEDLPAGLHSHVENIVRDASDVVAINVKVCDNTVTVIHADRSAKINFSELSWSGSSSASATGSSGPPRQPPPPPKPAGLSGKDEAPISTSSDSANVSAIPGIPLAEQPKEFSDIVNALPQQVIERVNDLLKDSQNNVSIQPNIQEGKASIICKKGNKISTLKASWNPDAWHARNYEPSQYEGLGAFNEGGNITSAGVTTSTTGGEIYKAKPGVPLVLQSKSFKDAIDDVPPQLQEKIVELLKDSKNEVSLDSNPTAGKAHLIYKCGTRISTLKANWDVDTSSMKPSASVQPHSIDIPPSSNSASNSIQVNSGSSSENHANPALGLRKLI